VLLRGDARAVLELADGASIEVDGGEAATWVERNLPGVVSARLMVDEPDDDADLRIDGGLVRLARIDQPPRAERVQEPARADADQVAVEAILVPVVPACPSPALDQDEVDHDGHTVAGGWDPSQFAPQQPGIPGQPPSPGVTSVPVARLVFSSGETVDVDRAVLVGRAPEARRFTSNEQPRLVTVPSPNQEISSTHLEVRPGFGADHGSAVVTDMGSTNGSVLTLPGLSAKDLQPGIAVQLVPGSLIDLGDGVTIHVTHP
jgi:hypothetical protein